jgi:hypothetical protein
MWVYNLSSRTRILGFSLAVIGCVIVELSTILSIALWPFTGQRGTLSLFSKGFTQHLAEILAAYRLKRLDSYLTDFCRSSVLVIRRVFHHQRKEAPLGP